MVTVSVLATKTIETSGEKVTKWNSVMLEYFLSISKPEAMEQVVQTFITIEARIDLKLDPKTFIRITNVLQVPPDVNEVSS